MLCRHMLLSLPLLGSTLTLFLSPGIVTAEAPPQDKSVSRIVFADHFLPKTMRIDYFHCGTATEQHIALDSIVSDGPWAGNLMTLVDPLQHGEYQYEVRDAATEQLLFSRGFCSVFGEWQTTAPAKQRWGTFHESLRFPWPLRQVEVTLKQRLAGKWVEIWTDTVDPESRFVTDTVTPRRDTVWTVFEHGKPTEKVDIVILGDGYTSEDLPKFHAAAKRLTESLFSVEPFKSRRDDFNVRAIDVPAAESGISRPRSDIFRRSPLGCQYNTFDLPRYVLTYDNKTVRNVAAQAPYEYLVILLNEKTYGGGGIYNDQTIVAAETGQAGYVMIHEFGHHIAGLADEYYSSSVAYETGKPITLEPWEPNVTALLDGKRPKWNDLVSSDVPIPTPWNKTAFETRGKKTRPVKNDAGENKNKGSASKQVKEQPKTLAELLAENEYAEKVGAFEGARYEAQGLYRPAVTCAMFSRSTSDFCPVCRRAIEQVIDMQTQH